MKKFTVLIALLFAISTQAQNVINREVGDFYELKVFNKINVVFKQGDENKVSISGSKRENVNVKNIDGLLKISMSIGNLWDDNNTQVIVWGKSIETIDVNEGSSVRFKSGIKAESLTLRAQEGATMRGDLDVKRLKVKAVTGGIINATGKVYKQEITITTGGSYLAKYLEADTTEVDVVAGGTAEVKATRLVKATTNAGGVINIYGKPEEIDSKKRFGGKIIEVNE